MRAVHVTDIEGLELPSFGFLWRPVRHALGIEAFGVNAYTATDPEGELIEEHDETGGGAGRHEEIYVVLSGHATFRIGAEILEAPAGTLVFCNDPGERRSAIGREAGTTVLAIGGRPGEAFAVSPWESYFLAFAELERGNAEGGRLELERGLERHPENGSMHYNAACFFARTGERGRALEHLSRAIALEPKTAGWAVSDEDLDPIRDDPAFPSLQA